MPDRIVIPSHNGRRGHPIVLPWTIAAQIHSLPAGVGRQRAGGSASRHRSSSWRSPTPRSSPTSTRRRPRHWISDRTGAAEIELRFQIPSPDRGRRFRSRARSPLRPGEGSGRALRARDRADATDRTVADLRAALGERLPALAPLLSTVMIAVDEEYAGDDVPISPGSRLAVIPPVSGGAGAHRRTADRSERRLSHDDRDHRRTDRSRGRHRTRAVPAGGGRLHVSGDRPRDDRRSSHGRAGLRSLSRDGPEEDGRARGGSTPALADHRAGARASRGRPRAGRSERGRRRELPAPSTSRSKRAGG